MSQQLQDLSFNPELSDPAPAASDGDATWDVRVPAALAFAAALLVYLLPRMLLGATFGFVNYDDPYLLAGANPAIGTGLLGGLPQLLAFWSDTQFMDAWLPLYYWSLGLDHALFGDAAWGYHLHSIVLHGVGAALVVGIAREMRLGRTAALIAGVLFALHPAASESVAWVASRKDVLSFVWMAAAALFYLRAERLGREPLHLLGVLCLGIALTAKGTPLVLPLLMLVYAWWRPDGRSWFRRLMPIIPYAAVAAHLTFLHYRIAAGVGTLGAGTGASLGELLVADLEVVARYAALLLVPVHQSVEHGLSATDPHGLWMALGAVLLLAWGTGIALALREGRRGIVAALLAVPLALAPFNNILPRTSALFAERYAYIALLPVALAIGAGAAARLRGTSQGAWRGILAAAALVCAGLTMARTQVWSDSISLWEDARDKAPRSALIRMQLAEALGTDARSLTETEDADRAKELHALARTSWEDAISLAATDLDRMRARSGLAQQLLLGASHSGDARGDLERADGLLVEAETLLAGIQAPGSLDARKLEILGNRATIREYLGRKEEALADWEAAAELETATANTFNAVARLCIQRGRVSDALEALAKSHELAGTEPTACLGRVQVLAAMGDLRGAKKEIVESRREHPDNVPLLLELAQIDLQLMRPLAAEESLRRAQELRPDDERIRVRLAATLLAQAESFAARDDIESAREAAAKAAALAPESFAPAQILGIVARRAGDLELAHEQLRAARNLHPDGKRIAEQLASVLVERGAKQLDDGREGLALTYLAEAVAVGSRTISTRTGRLDAGVDGWPPPPSADEGIHPAWIAALRGVARIAFDRAHEALVDLEAAEVSSRGGDPRLRRVVLELLTRARFRAGQWDKAVEAAEELPALTVELPGVDPWRGPVFLATALVERGIARRGARDETGAAPDFERARDLLDEGRERGLPESRFHVRLGEIRFAEEDFLEATRSWDRAIELDPAEVDAYLNLASLWRAQYLIEEDSSFLEGALENLHRARRRTPGDPRVMAALGDALVMRQKPSEAYPWLQRAVLADPSQRGARVLLSELAIRAGRSHLEKGELEDARVIAERTLSLAADSPNASLFMADVLRAEGKWGEAQARIEATRAEYPLASEPTDALVKLLTDAGHGYLLKDDRVRAVSSFRDALAIEGGEEKTRESAQRRLEEIASATFREGVERHEDGDLDGSIRLLRISVQAVPLADTYFALGYSLARAEDFAGAEQAYARALELNGALLDAMMNRGQALAQLGRLDEAEREFRRFLGSAPKDHVARAGVEAELQWIEKVRKELE